MISLKSRFAAVFLGLMAAAGAASAEEALFNNPKVGSQPLDLCLNWGADCGKPAADAWCASKGYVESTGHSVAADVGATTPTRLISTGAVCDQGYCDAISAVTCFKPDPVEKVYKKPKLNGARLDLCVNWGVDCGEPAATMYCQSKGWGYASDYTIASDVGLVTPTRLIGTGAVCDQEMCDAFETITCKN